MVLHFLPVILTYYTAKTIGEMAFDILQVVLFWLGSRLTR
jgi:hypothetical protein